MSGKQILRDLQSSIKGLRYKKPYIISLRFPNYRNLKFDAELPFDFPITILLGRNGTNKSSILHALYGSPKGNSIGDFWFETELDAIPEERNKRKQSVVHKYRNQDGEIVECIKARAPRGDQDPDYWEPVKHTKVYGFPESGIRVSPIELNVKYIDFRSELPAFDKYFYFYDQKHLSKLARNAKQSGRLRRNYRQQDYIRRRSKSLKKTIKEEGIRLNKEELAIVNYILERDYVRGTLLEHSYFHGHHGWTILFETKYFSGYSDAFAGSGESAATLLVYKILRIPKNSLLLLDEPETSLHPRAQKRMMEFIADQALTKSLQVVVATHSIHLAQGLPSNAIRVLVLEANGTVQVSTELSADEALHEIDNIPSGKTILVEDKRAKQIVESALKLVSPYALKEFQVLPREGGTSRLYRDIQSFAHSKRNNIFCILDGDHAPQTLIPDKGKLPQGKKELQELVQEITRGNNQKGPKLDFVDQNDLTLYIETFKKFVYFLPEKTPEAFVWHDESAEEMLEGKLPQSILNEKDFKKRLYLLSEEITGFDSDTVFSTLLNKTLKGDSPRKKQLLELIEAIRNATS